MKKIIYVLIISIVSANLSIAFATSKNNFQFQVSEYHTKRQSGQTLDLYVRYAMKDDVDYTAYPDYRALRTIAMAYLEPTPSLPINTYWEVIAAKMGDELMARYPLSGVSIQMLVHPNEMGEIYEPGFHGPIYTVGDVIPLSQTVTPTSSNSATNPLSNKPLRPLLQLAK